MNDASNQSFRLDHQTRPPGETLSSAGSPSRNNNFNLLRFLLATLVILSHSFELVDGNGHREILRRIFGTVTFGELAVDGFFLLSGFLIVQSWSRTPNLLDFLQKRALRIYPGFIVASLVCAFAVGPLGSDPHRYFAQFHLLRFLEGVLLLRIPLVPPVFQGQPYPSINGSMWTIGYEFRCYLLVALLGLCGVVARKWWWLGLSGAFLLLSLRPEFVTRMSPHELRGLSQDPVTLIRFLSLFCTGGSFYLFRERIRYHGGWALIAALLLVACLFGAKTAHFGLVVGGAYVLFWFAFTPFTPLQRFQTWPDISYGVYLYGWPVQKLLLWYLPALSPWFLFGIACTLSCGCGWLSWHLVERPALRLKRQPDANMAT